MTTPKAGGAMPVPLTRDAAVAVLSPGYQPSADALDRGLRLLRQWGLRPELLTAPSERIATGEPDEYRLESLEKAFTGDYGAVLCTRGGFGSARIVEEVSVNSFVERRGAFVGFSDMTTIHTRLNQAGLVTYYGPAIAWDVDCNGAEDANPPAAISLFQTLFERPLVPLEVRTEDLSAKLCAGEAVVAPLVGGNLATLASNCGTRSQLRADGAIVFLEEVDEPLASIDRSLTQLDRSGALDGVAGFLIGQLDGYVEGEGGRYDAARLIELVRSRLSRYGVPVLGGVPVGHGENQHTLALGSVVKIDPSEQVLLYMD